MSIKATVLEQTKEAMRAKDKDRLMVLRLIASEFKRIEVDERIELDKTRELAVLDKMLKQRRESIMHFEAAGRNELAAKEQFEIEIIQSFMPQPLSEAQVKQIIEAAIRESNAASVQEMGKVMAIVRPQCQGRADMSQVSQAIKSLLGTK